MRTPQDLLRSLQRYVAGILPAPWDVRIALEGSTPARPFALVTQNAGAAPIGKFGAGSIQLQAPYTVHAYLAEGASRRDAELAAQQLEEAFFVAFKVQGIPPATRGDVVPLWDFIGDTTSGVDPPRGHCDYANISAFSVQPIADPSNPRLQMVAADLTLTWWRAGSASDQGSPLTGATTTDTPVVFRTVQVKLDPNPDPD